MQFFHTVIIIFFPTRYNICVLISFYISSFIFIRKKRFQLFDRFLRYKDVFKFDDDDALKKGGDISFLCSYVNKEKNNNSSIYIFFKCL